MESTQSSLLQVSTCRPINGIAKRFVDCIFDYGVGEGVIFALSAADGGLKYPSPDRSVVESCPTPTGGADIGVGAATGFASTGTGGGVIPDDGGGVGQTASLAGCKGIFGECTCARSFTALT